MEPLCCPAKPQPSAGGEAASLCLQRSAVTWGQGSAGPSASSLPKCQGCCQGPQLQSWARAGTCCCNCPSAHSMRLGPEHPSCPAACSAASTSITCRQRGDGVHLCPFGCPLAAPQQHAGMAGGWSELQESAQAVGAWPCRCPCTLSCPDAGELKCPRDESLSPALTLGASTQSLAILDVS